MKRLIRKWSMSFIFLIFILSFSFAWWNNWNYRVPVNVTEQSGSDLTNFQVKIVMDTASLISDGKMNSDCSDIRIVDSDDSTELPYWIETENSSEACNTTTTAIWTKLNLTASSTKTIYVYYGNSDATSESNGSAVFDAFDDFNDGVISGDWTVVLGEAHEIDGYLIVNGSTSAPGPMTWWNARTFDSSYIVETTTVIDTQSRLIRNAQSLSTSDDFDMFFVDSVNDNERIYHWDGSDWSSLNIVSFTCDNGDYIVMKTFYLGTTLHGYANSSEVSADTDFTSGYAGLGGYSGKNTKYDWFRVRKYADPEPTTSVGTEELYHWWDPDWDYRRPIDVTEQTGSDLTDYQVKIVLDTESLISAGKMNADCSDIRIVDSDDSTKLPYWIADGTCNSSSTEIWTKLDLTASSTKTIYVYYGNSGATSESNGDNVFNFFDDFEGTSLDASKWNTDVSDGEITMSDGTVKLHGLTSSAQVKMYSAQTFGNTLVFEDKAKSAQASNVLSVFDDLSSPSNYGGYGHNENVNSDYYFVYSNDGSGEARQTSSFALDSSGFHTFRIDRLSDDTLKFYFDGEYDLTADKKPAGNLVIYLRLFDSTNTLEIDWIRVRKYASTEPTTDVGNEETKPQINAIFSISHTPVYPLTNSNVTLEVVFTNIPLNYTILWGDGDETINTNPEGTHVSEIHKYTSHGDYTVNVTAYFDDNSTDSKTDSISVYDPITNFAYQFDNTQLYIENETVQINFSWTGGSDEIFLNYSLNSDDKILEFNISATPNSDNEFSNSTGWLSNVKCSLTSCGYDIGFATIVDKKTGDNETINLEVPVGYLQVTQIYVNESSPYVVNDTLHLIGKIKLAYPTPFNVTRIWNIESSDTLTYSSSDLSKELTSDYKWLVTSQKAYVPQTSGSKTATLTVRISNNSISTQDISNDTSFSVNDITVSLCSASDPGVFVHIRFLDEKNESKYLSSDGSLSLTFVHDLGGSKQFSTSFTSKNETWVCITPVDKYTLDGIIQYTSTNYRTREYYFLNANIDSSSSFDLNLYNIETAISDLETITVKDGISLVPNVYLILQKYDIGSNTYKIVQIAKTNDNGEASVYVEPYDSFYRMLVNNGTEIIYQGEALKFMKSTYTLNIQENIDTTVLDIESNLNYNCTYNQNTSIVRCTVSDPSGVTQRVTFKAGTENMWGTNQVCENTQTGLSSMTFICDLNGSSGSPYATLIVDLDGYDNYVLYHNVWSGSGSFTRESGFGAFVIVSGLALIGTFHPVAAVAFALVGVVVSVMTGMLWVGCGSLAGLITVAVIYWLIRRGGVS